MSKARSAGTPCLLRIVPKCRAKFAGTPAGQQLPAERRAQLVARLDLIEEGRERRPVSCRPLVGRHPITHPNSPVPASIGRSSDLTPCRSNAAMRPRTVCHPAGLSAARSNRSVAAPLSIGWAATVTLPARRVIVENKTGRRFATHNPRHLWHRARKRWLPCQTRFRATRPFGSSR